VDDVIKVDVENNIKNTEMKEYFNVKEGVDPNIIQERI
jgi:hypothetical protein